MEVNATDVVIVITFLWACRKLGIEPGTWKDDPSRWDVEYVTDELVKIYE